MDIIDIFSTCTLLKFGFKPRKSQIKAAKLLAHKGSLVHMDTGEGKTVVAALAALLTAHDGRRVYVVTVNDYLAKRDFSLFSELFYGLGITVVLNTVNGDKRAVHAGSIIYTSVQSLLFDYVSNEFNTDGINFDLDMAILDEIDYVLLDSANTRFSASMGDGCVKQDTMLLDAVWHFCLTLSDDDFSVELHKKRVTLNDTAYQKIEEMFNITSEASQYCDVISYCYTALLARTCYLNGVDYIVEADGVLSILNRYNGRACRNSVFDHELDYFLRKKENIRFSCPAGSFANTMSAPVLFRKFKTVVGMSGTVKQAREELRVLVGSGTQTVRPSKRLKRIDRIVQVKTKKEKYSFIKEFINEHREEYAFLVICEHEREAYELFERLNTDSSFNLLTNQYADNEQALLDEAGRAGNVLISTYMVGRGTDIVTDAKLGLCAFITHKSSEKRSILQARGRAGRNGTRGCSFTLVSREDVQGLSSSDFEAQRAFNLCEDVIFENAKLSLIEWAEKNGVPESLYVPYWLDFRRSLTGRLFVNHLGDLASAVYKACGMVRSELRELVWDIRK